MAFAFVSETVEVALIPAFDSSTGVLPPRDHRATLEQIARRFGFTPRCRRLLKGLRVLPSMRFGRLGVRRSALTVLLYREASSI
jgi:hypothetical protein